MCKINTRFFTRSKFTLNNSVESAIITYSNNTTKTIKPGTEVDLIKEQITKINFPCLEKKSSSLKELQFLPAPKNFPNSRRKSDLHAFYFMFDYCYSDWVQTIEPYHICP